MKTKNNWFNQSGIQQHTLTQITNIIICVLCFVIEEWDFKYIFE